LTPASGSAATRRTLPPALFLGAAVASIGGPLALVALYVPGAAGAAVSSLGLTVALAVVVFAVPLAIWLAYSERIASAGGLTAFVEAASGRTVARVQALVWTVSYFLYLPYTVTYVVYDVLAVVFPGLRPYRASLELILPAAIVVLVLAPLAAVLVVVAAVAVVQLVLVVVLGALALNNTGGHGAAFTHHAGTAATGRGVAGVALLFVCLSLPLFFGAEVQRATHTIRRGLAAAYAAVAALLLFAAVPLASVPSDFRNADLPGVAIAQAYSGRGLAVTIGLASAASVAALIVLEYLALGRLAHWLLGTAIRPTLAAIGVPFIVADAFSLIDPDRFYDDLLRPSLIALFLSQLVVFAAFPLFRLRTNRRRVPAAIALASVACGLVGYGLYTVITGPVGT
jgi:amino acid transporter